MLKKSYYLLLILFVMGIVGLTFATNMTNVAVDGTQPHRISSDCGPNGLNCESCNSDCKSACESCNSVCG
ncbi:MAG: hypothetical protein LBV42_01770 [Methanobrevibacter sp.]|jgi:hypothetical protein|nr:hypothetical protein [Methanobrevibacter sp.]